MMPARCFAELPPETLRASRRSLVIIVAAVVLAAAGVLGWWLTGSLDLVLVLLLGLLLGRALSVVGLPRESQPSQLNQPSPPPATSTRVALRLPARPGRELTGEIRCNPFFELLSASSL